MSKHYSTKHYGHNIGLSAVFRQPNADHSHCHLLHGYSLAFTFTFGCDELDNKNWAVDFGGLKPLKAWLEDNFDHKLCLDNADPMIDEFKRLYADSRIKKNKTKCKFLNNLVQNTYEKYAITFYNEKCLQGE